MTEHRESPAPLAFAPGAVVRQYHDATRRRYDDATITAVHDNGALDVIGADGQPYGWSRTFCEVIRPAPVSEPTPVTEKTAANATHRLFCQHVCRWTKTYTMPCHVLKEMPDGRRKVLVFGDRHWKNREHVSRVRYVEADRLEQVATDAQ